MAATTSVETVTLPIEGQTSTDNDETQPNGESDTTCGIGAFQPACLQRCKRMSVVTGAFSVSVALTVSLSIYIGSQITTIEKHFGLTSSQSGFLLSCNDIGFLLTTLLAGYVARHVHIPRGLFLSMCLYGLGGWVCSLAYFISKDIFKSKVEDLELMQENVSNTVSMQAAKDLRLCKPNDHSSFNAAEMSNEDDTYVVGLPNKYSTIAIVLIAVGMMIQGVCKSIRAPFTLTYIDDNGKKRNTAMYIGILYAAIGIGPAVSFVAGGIFSKRYVTLEDVPISPSHPSWIGAWWLGFIIFGLISMVTAFPLALFPRQMKPKRISEKNRKANQRTSLYRRLCNTVADFLKIILRLGTNRVYVLVLLVKIMAVFVIAGLSGFGPKYMETQFFLPAWKANVYVALTIMAPICLATTTTGVWLTKRRFTPLDCIKLIMAAHLASIVLIAPGYILGCSNPTVVGLNTDLPRSQGDTNGTCGTLCNCHLQNYFPVCGSDGRNYFSPCEAGCKSDQQERRGPEPSQLFTECGCISPNATAAPGLCSTDCNMLIPFLIMFTLVSITTASCMIPGIILNLRSVKDEEKSMALGLDSLSASALGWLIGPVLFGRIIDSTCLLWTTSQDLKGACALYDNDLFRIATTTFVIVPKIIALLLLLFLYPIARRKTDWSVDTVRNAGSVQDLQTGAALIS